MMALVRGEDERDGGRGNGGGGGEYDCGDAPARFSQNVEPRQRAHAEVWRSLGLPLDAAKKARPSASAVKDWRCQR